MCARVHQAPACLRDGGGWASGRRSELAWSPTDEASQCKRDGDAAIGLTARNAIGRGRASTGYACATRPPVRRARQSAASHLPCATDDVRPTPRLACKIASLLPVGRPSPQRRCRRRMGAAEQSGAEQASLRFYASQLQASARIGSHPSTHILPARRQQLIIITRFLTKK